ncbi:DHH family phosphoesterase [Clostridium sp. 'White wine YQ']|uniref:DHH family phosphoesterase n=1 Tax=Clostridium sp. 'White wine YQ' TaxID=3027474 RepID=UPI0023669891|nr:DHH family phosphoesterase [Clostridium sp. 'White wine YQ']MDD7794048.1 DHH family phosphoesterase [Clostridium sp. 'White wine YQ']
MSKQWEKIYRPNYISGYNPFIIKNMNRAIERVVDAINSRKKILVYGLCDVDGICALSSLILLLKYLNADVEYIIEDYSHTNHLIQEADIKNRIHFLGADLLITVGCRFKGNREVELSKALGIETIIMENSKSNGIHNTIYINPNQTGCSYRYKNLSNSALTFKLMQAIGIYYNMNSINRYLDLIFLGSVFKKCEKQGENKVFLSEGFNYLRETNNYGLRAIFKYLKIESIMDEDIDGIINLLTPINNSVSVMDTAKIIVELLTTSDMDRAEQIVKYLNFERKKTNIFI